MRSVPTEAERSVELRGGVTSGEIVRGNASAPASRWLVLVLVCAAQFMVVLDATIVNVALPSIQHGLNFSVSGLQWVINAYTLIFGGFLLLGGRAADLAGRRRLFLAGIALFSVASLLNGLAGSSGVLIVGRGLQGLGGALLSPAALSIITTTFAEGRERARALGVWSAIAAGGGAFGLLLGGVLTDTVGWRWVFFVNVPIGALVILASLRFVPESRAFGAGRGVDVAGAVTVTGGLVALVYGIVEAQQVGWTSARTLGMAALAVVLLTTFVRIQQRVAHPLIRLSLLRTRSLAGADLALLLAAGGLFSLFFFASIYVQEILGYSPLRAGLAFLPVTASIAIGAGVAQVLLRRTSARNVAIVGLAVAATGLGLLSRITVTGSYATGMLPGLLLMAVGMGLTFVPVTLLATSNVAERDAGLASGLLNTAQQVGGALGLAVLATVSAQRTSGWLSGLHHAPSAVDQATGLVEGFRLAFVAGGLLLLAGAVLIGVLVRDTSVASPEAEAATLPGHVAPGVEVDAAV